MKFERKRIRNCNGRVSLQELCLVIFTVWGGMFALTTGLIHGKGLWAFTKIPVGMAVALLIMISVYVCFYLLYLLLSLLDWISRKIGED